jgi:hypothetical protein
MYVGTGIGVGWVVAATAAWTSSGVAAGAVVEEGVAIGVAAGAGVALAMAALNTENAEGWGLGTERGVGVVAEPVKFDIRENLPCNFSKFLQKISFRLHFFATSAKFYETFGEFSTDYQYFYESCLNCRTSEIFLSKFLLPYKHGQNNSIESLELCSPSQARRGRKEESWNK